MNHRKADRWEDLRFRALRLLAANPELSQRDLARGLGISVGRVNYCLKALVDKGLIKYDNFTASPHKLRYAYILTPAGLAEKARITGRFLQRKRAEYERLREEIESLCAEVANASDMAASGAKDADPVP